MYALRLVINNSRIKYTWLKKMYALYYFERIFMFSYFLLCCCYLSCLPVWIAATYISTESVRLGTLNVSTFGNMYP